MFHPLTAIQRIAGEATLSLPPNSGNSITATVSQVIPTQHEATYTGGSLCRTWTEVV